MINQLQFDVHDSRGRRTIRYTHGVKLIEYVTNKSLRITLESDYVCEDKALLPDYNESCEPFVHVFHNVEYLIID